MIDNSIFTQAKANLVSRRKEAATKIFEKVIESIDQNLSSRSIRFSTKTLCEIIGFTLRDFELEDLINEYLPNDCGITFVCGNDIDRTFVFDFSQWLNQN